MDSPIVLVARQEYVRARKSQRVVAALIDLGLCWMLVTLASPATFPIALVYLFMGDGICRGARLGKRLVGLKVIDARHGTPIGIFQDFLRNCGRYSIFSFGGFGALLRAYDHAAGNIPAEPEFHVVLTRPVAESDRPPAPPPEKPAKLDLEGMKRSLENHPQPQ